MCCELNFTGSLVFTLFCRERCTCVINEVKDVIAIHVHTGSSSVKREPALFNFSGLKSENIYSVSIFFSYSFLFNIIS